MNFGFIALEKTATAQQPGGGASMLITFGWLAIMLVVMYFLMIRPQRKKQKEEKQMRENLQVGDEIVTIGGIYGRVISLKEDTMVIESLSDHSKMTLSRWALQTNNTVHDEDVFNVAECVCSVGCACNFIRNRENEVAVGGCGTCKVPCVSVA